MFLPAVFTVTLGLFREVQFGLFREVKKRFIFVRKANFA